MKQSKRLRFGRFYTPPGVADLTLGLAVRAGSDRIWDPTCGDGSFLRQAIHRGHSPELLFGHDVDPAAVSATRKSIPGARDEHADLFSLDPEQTGLFDAIAGNPPFVRVERMPSERRSELRRRTSEALGFAPPAQTDLSVLSLLHCLRFLAPGGRLAFVMPNTWMDADFSRPIRRWLLQHYSLRAVVESRCEPWFPQARVNTVIVVFEASSSTRQPTFARCLAPASGALAPGILGDAPAEPESLQLRHAPAADERWSTLLRAPDLWFEVHERAAGRLVPLGDPERPVLSKAYGTKVGISAFFSQQGRLRQIRMTFLPCGLVARKE